MVKNKNNFHLTKLFWLVRLMEDIMVDNLIDWKLELTLQERLTKREAAASFVDDAGLTLALALLPWIVLIQIMF